jgi:hypothetical protein
MDGFLQQEGLCRGAHPSNLPLPIRRVNLSLLLCEDNTNSPPRTYLQQTHMGKAMPNPLLIRKAELKTTVVDPENKNRLLS